MRNLLQMKQTDSEDVDDSTVTIEDGDLTDGLKNDTDVTPGAEVDFRLLRKIFF